jgi:hypothetical protein|tara:strand:- start:75 stop:695 length:621 start_codon:yes stop_codon:yes gene_type:complete
MKKTLLLLIALLIVGCDYAPTEHTHDTTHEHVDIYGCTDSTATNFNPDATIFDNTCEYPSEIFDVEWILIKDIASVYEQIEGDECYYIVDGEIEPIVGVGYKLIITSSSGIEVENDILVNNEGILSFTYNEETFTYDLSDSFIYELADCGVYYRFTKLDVIDGEGIERIIINMEGEFGQIFWGCGIEGCPNAWIDLSSPIEIIDYR